MDYLSDKVKKREVEKKRDFVCASRPSRQKVTSEIEIMVESVFRDRIYRPKCNTWEEYYDFLAESKYMITSAKEETFGYQVMDAILADCIPFAPNKFSYPELLPQELLYDSPGDLIDKIMYFKENPRQIELLCGGLCSYFCHTITKEMYGGIYAF